VVASAGAKSIHAEEDYAPLAAYVRKLGTGPPPTAH